MQEDRLARLEVDPHEHMTPHLLVNCRLEDVHDGPPIHGIVIQGVFEKRIHESCLASWKWSRSARHEKRTEYSSQEAHLAYGTRDDE